MIQTGLIKSPYFLRHDTGPNHPESPKRLESVLERLQTSPVWSSLKHLDPRPATASELTRVHPSGYLKWLEESCGGEIGNAFCAIRPPGHHAELEEAMGFCLFNNAAVAARTAQEQFGAEKILILDWDVHHGNGTQHLFEEDPTVHFISLHEFPLYPGTGAKDETGKGDGLGTTTNFPLKARGGDELYMDIFENVLPDIVMGFKPDFIILSAGFDAHVRDPLASMKVSKEGFARMTDVMTGLAAETCRGKLVSILEGGYDLQGLSESVEAHLIQLDQAARG